MMPEEGWGEVLANFLRDVLRIKLGPGVLGTIVPINLVGLLVTLGIGGAFLYWGQPLFAFIGAGCILAFLIYVNERAFRYAERNPVAALMSGAQMGRLLRDQMSAKDRSLIIDEKPVVATTTKQLNPPNESKPDA
jgi:hypothetical protein